jgi:hypothetical protein
MYMIPQYAFAGDFTGMDTLFIMIFLPPFNLLSKVEAIMKGVTEVAKYDAGPLAGSSSFRIKLIELPS